MMKVINIEFESYLGTEVYNAGLGNYPLSKGRWTLTLKKYRETRSVGQNKRYWGYVLPAIAMETGHEIEELHEFFKCKFGEVKMKEIFGEDILVGSTKAMDTKQFTNYTDQIVAFAATELKIKLPEKLSDVELDDLDERYNGRYG